MYTHNTHANYDCYMLRHIREIEIFSFFIYIYVIMCRYTSCIMFDDSLVELIMEYVDEVILFAHFPIYLDVSA